MNAYYSSCRHGPHWWLFRSFLTFCYGEQYHNEHPWKKLHTCPINSSGSFLEGELLGQSACTSKYRNLLLAGCTHERGHWTLRTQERNHFSEGSKLINLGGQHSNTDELLRPPVRALISEGNWTVFTAQGLLPNSQQPRHSKKTHIYPSFS